MFSTKATAVVGAERARVWRFVDELLIWDRVHPLVETCEALGHATSGLGAERRLVGYDKSRTRERVVAYEKGRAQTVESTETDWPFSWYALRLELSDLPPGEEPPPSAVRASVAGKADAKAKPAAESAPTGPRTQVVASFRFRPKDWQGLAFGLTRTAPEWKKVLEKILQGLDEHLRTGKVVGKGGILKPAPKPVVA